MEHYYPAFSMPIVLDTRYAVEAGPDPAARTKLWENCSSRFYKQDQNLLETWKGDADGILIFTGLFSATVAAFTIESYKLLQQDSGDVTVALLLQISQQLSTNGSSPIPAATIPPFRPSSASVRVNIFWFLSLCLSITCALSATLMQQWARRYAQAAHGRYDNAFMRTLIRGYLFDGVTRLQLSNVVEVIPLLLHISVFLFFAGLVQFMFTIHHAIAIVILTFVLCTAAIYLAITILPLGCFNSPYQTPLTPVAWRLFRLVLRAMDLISAPLRLGTNISVPHRFSSTRDAVEKVARGAERPIIGGALKKEAESLEDDQQCEDFLAGLGGLSAVQFKETVDDFILDAGGLLKEIFKQQFYRWGGSLNEPSALSIERATIFSRALWNLTCFSPLGTRLLRAPMLYGSSPRSWITVTMLKTSPSIPISTTARCLQAIAACHRLNNLPRHPLEYTVYAGPLVALVDTPTNLEREIDSQDGMHRNGPLLSLVSFLAHSHAQLLASQRSVPISTNLTKLVTVVVDIHAQIIAQPGRTGSTVSRRAFVDMQSRLLQLPGQIAASTQGDAFLRANYETIITALQPISEWVLSGGADHHTRFA